MKLRAAIGAALATVLVVGAARQVSQGERATSACDLALEHGDAREAIVQARIAAESVLPFSPYARRGQERLAHIAADAEGRGDDATAAAAWRASRAAAMETRAVGSGSAAWIARANEGLARVAAHGTPVVGDVPSALARETGPTSWEWLLLAIVALAMYALAERFLRGRRA